MVCDFLRKKWEAHFVANDLNGDGMISAEDANIFAERFVEYHNMKDEKAQTLKAAFKDVWSYLFLFDREKIDRETYLNLMEKECAENKAKFVERHRRAVRSATWLIDVNMDGHVSEDEFVIAMKCWGIKSLDRKYVQAYPQIKPGYISNETFADSWIAFHTSGDENDAELERPVMFGLRMLSNV